MFKRVLPLVVLRKEKLLSFLVVFIGLAIGLFQWSTVPVAGKGPKPKPTPVHTVYVSSPTDGKIVKVEVDANGGVSASVVFPKKRNDAPAGFAPTSLTFGPDGKLWAVSGSEIWKVDPTSGSASVCYSFPTNGMPPDPSTPGDIRFLSNVPYFTATGTGGSSGVWRFGDLDCGSPEKVSSTSLSAPGGLVFSLTGRLFYLDAGARTLYRADPPFGSSGSVYSSLGNPVAVATRGSHGFPTTHFRTYVSTGNQIKVLTCADTSASCSPSSNISFGTDSVRDLEANLSGQLLVASLPSGSDPKLWIVEGGAKMELVDFDDVNGQASIGDIWGVAIPPTSYSPSGTAFGPQTTRFNCGNSLVDVTASGATTVECKLALPGDVDSQFGGEATGAHSISYDWNNGFATIMLVEPENLEKTVLVTYVRQAEPLATNPLMVSDYNEVTIIDYFPKGALDPLDGTRRGRASDVVVADEAIDDAAGFFRYRPDLSFDVDDPSVVTGGTLPIRIDFYEGCELSQTLRLTVVCNAGDPGNLDTSITPISNGNTNFENYFRCGEGSGWYYNLDLDASGVPTLQEAGSIDAATCAITGWGDVGAPTPLVYFYRP